MTTLEKYLTEEHPLDMADLADIEATAKSVAGLYNIEFGTKTAWPYQLVNGEAKLPGATQGDTQKGDTPKGDTPKGDTPKGDTPKGDTSKVGVPEDDAAEAEAGPKLSQSTTAMITNALLRFAGYFRGDDTRISGLASRANLFPVEGVGKVFSPDKANRTLKTNVVEASLELLRLIPLGQDKPLTDSKTYGLDDIFTIAWLAELSAADWNLLEKRDPKDQASWDASIQKKWSDLASGLRWAVSKKAVAWVKPLKTGTEGKLFTPPAGNTSSEHAFSVLRLAQTIRRLFGGQQLYTVEGWRQCRERDMEILGESVQEKVRNQIKKELDDANVAESPSKWLDQCHRFFEATLHQQLSFSAIPDSRFDPAELVFCLEGMLICKGTSVDRTIFDRVLLVLSAAQEESAYWRPVKPFMSTEQGAVLFPVSVEIANSLMRSCAIFDAEQTREGYGSKCIPLLRRYWQWLRARAVQVQGLGSGPYKTMGWHSEHVNDPTRVHLWETSQVMEFLLGYKDALHRHVARTTLVLARFTQEVLPSQPWSETEKNEPVTKLGPELQIYKRIGAEFVTPHIEAAQNKSYSMLLYGPPGTGKTTIAKGIARALDRRLITITVSDFLAEGGAQVEARAKNIFTVLMAQHSCVVLFDEIDHFLLDRDSERYTKQDTVFQFMTPGMLTKLNDLRAQQRSLFIVATNYEDRIDAAIKRTGRIDEKYLVLPPAMATRVTMIKEQMLEAGLNINGSNGKPLALPKPKLAGETKSTEELAAEKRGEPDFNALARAALFLGFKDIQGTIVRAKERKIDALASLEKAFVDRSRTTSIEAYTSRFSSSSGHKLAPRETPIGEFLGLLALHCEANPDQIQVAKAGLDNVQLRAARAALVVLQGDDDPSPDFTEENALEMVKRNAQFLEHPRPVATLLRAIWKPTAGSKSPEEKLVTNPSVGE